MRKRLLSILLLCCMVLTLLPTAAVAKANYIGSAATAAVTDDAHRWDTKIEITNVTPGQEYAITTGTTAPTEGWQDSGVFTGLKKNTAYTVYTRVKATDTVAASDSVTTSVKTKKAMSLLVFNWEELGSWVSGPLFYDGSAKVPPVNYKPSNSAATVGVFTVKYKDQNSGASVTECKLPGTYDFYIVTDNTGSEYAAGEEHMGTFTISRGNLNEANFQVTGLSHDYDGSPKAATVARKSGVEGVGTITVYYEGVAPTVYIRQTTAPTNAGSYKVSVDVATGDYYNGINNLVLGTLTIKKVNYTGTPFTGTVNIIGAPKFNETLTANVTDSNNTGTLTYQWYREGKTDPIGTGETYTLVQADIGKEITCRVSSSTETGTIETTVGPVEKADGPAAPVIELDFRSINIIKVKPLGNAYEYRIDNGEWQDLHYFENLQPGTEYTITARAKETATHKPGAVSEPLTVATLFDMIPDDLKAKLTAVVSAYKAEYDGMEHEAVIVDMSKMPEGWSIAGHTAGTGDDFVPQIPKIRNVSGSNLTVKTKFTHLDYGQSLIVYSYPEITPKPLTADMIADIPNQLYTGQSIHPEPEIKDGNTPLVKDKDFTYSYDTNTSSELGGKVTITGKGNYKGSASKNFSIVNEITEITEDDLKDLEIPTLVTVKCKTTGDSKAYGRIPGGFDLSKKPYMENGVWKAIVQLNLSAYKAKYDVDTKKTHEYAGGEGNPHAAFTLKYVNDKWELDGTFPNVIILVKCDGQHPQTPPYPTEENVGGLEQVQVRVQCSTDRTQFKNYGILSGGVSIMPDANDPSQATLTLIPSVYSTQYSTDTGITHIVDPSQTTDNLKIQMRYDPAVGKWMPAGVLTPLKVLVQCNNHQGQRYTINFNGNGGTPSVTSMTTIDQKLPELPTATHSGRYSFDGWYTAASGGTKITTAYVFSANTTAYAHWTYTGGGGGWYYTYYTIKATAGTNGSISPSGNVSVREGRDQTFTITPDKGYAVSNVKIDGKSIGAVKSYTFENVKKSHTIEVIFMKANGNPQTGVFVDVPEGSYYEEAVDWAVENGITTGTGNNYFTPDGICTRAQAVTFLWRVAGSPTPKTEAMPFEDVLNGSYYYEAVLWAVENGITVGTSATTFSPELTCSRAHIVTFLWRAANSPSVKMDNPFTDVAGDAYYIDAVLWAVKHKITVGTTLSTFSPDEGCTRAQIVTFLYRAHSK